jgi:hypothetical protein
MRLFNVKGKLVDKNVSKYAINWNGKSKSQIQFKVKQFLKPYWCGCICYEEFPVFGTLLKVDILNATLHIAIEVNGPQHEEFHYFHNKEPFNYLKGITRDFEKLEWLKRNNFQLIEIDWKEIDKLSRSFFKEKFGIQL